MESIMKNRAKEIASHGNKETAPNMNVGVDMFRTSEKLPQQNLELPDICDTNSLYLEKDALSQTKKSGKNHWSVSWSDLMMTMFILFLVLYVYQSANRKFKFGEGKENISEVRENITSVSRNDDRRYSAESLENSNFEDKGNQPLSVQYSDDISLEDLVKDRAVRIILPGDLLFGIGKTELKAKAKKSLSEIAEIIKRNSYIVNVVGHTDNLPYHSDKYATNWELSVVRACTVGRFLIEEMGIPGSRFFFSGHAYHMPLKPNNSIQNRAANRRVEIILYKEKPFGIYKSVDNIYNLSYE